MKVNLQSVNFTIDQKLVNFVQNKLDKLENHHSKIVSAHVYLKVRKTSGKDNKISEILLNVPGTELMTKKTFKTFEEGVDECVACLDRQLRKRKEKQKLNA